MDREALDKVIASMSGAQLQLLIMLLTRVEPLQIPLPILRQQLQARVDAKLLAHNRSGRMHRRGKNNAHGKNSKAMICPQHGCGKAMRLTSRVDAEGDGSTIFIWYCSCGYSAIMETD